MADADTLHAVYTHLFSLCSLSAAHRRMLGALSDEQVARYGTLPADRATPRRILDRLIDTHGFATLRKVPGFALNEKKELVIRGAGVILPVRDVEGRIIAVDVRRDVVGEGQSKYYKLSSRSDQDDGAPSPGAPAHVAQPAGGVKDARTVWVTEGVKKADVVADRTGCVTISIPSIGNTPAALVPLEVLAGDIAVIALDRDAPDRNEGRTVEAVARAREELAHAARDLGYAVRIAEWSPADGKGVDDLLLASKTFTVERFTTTTINGDGNRIGNQTQLIGRIVDVVHNHSMKAVPKMGMIATMVALYEAERDPRQMPDDRGRYRILMCRMADDMGVTRNTGSTTIRELAGPQFQFLDVKQVENGEDGKTVTWLGLGPRCLGRCDKVAEPPHLKQERVRNANRRCPRCGSKLLRSASFKCGGCGHTCTATEAEAAASYILVREDGRLVDSRTGAFVEPQSSGDPCTVTVHGPQGSGDQRAEEGPCTATVHPPSGEEYDGCTATVHGGASIHAGHLTAWSETSFVRTPSARTPAEELHANYRRWCATQHEQPCSWKVVESWLAESGAHLHHGDRGPVWLGIGLLVHDVAGCQEDSGAEGTDGPEHSGDDDGVVVDLAARKAEREQAQAPGAKGLFAAGAGDASSPLFKCSDCRAPISKPYGRCAPCRSAEYARLGMEE